MTGTGDRPLAGRRIALTRLDPGPLAEQLAELGAEVVHVPLIAIVDPPDGGMALRRALARVDAFDWVVVTSVNGARAVGAAVATHPRVRLAAVGPATAAALTELAGRPVDLVARDPRAEGLVADFPGSGSRVLIAQADRARATLAEGLAARGHAVETVTAYSTVERRPPPEELALLDDVDAVVFASGSAVESWVAARGTNVPPVVVVIGPVTEQVARRVGVAVTRVAESPGPAGVAAALLAAWRA